MDRSMRAWLAVAAAFAAFGSAPVRADDVPADEPIRSVGDRVYDGALLTYDAAVIRPVGVVRIVVGSALLGPASLLAAPGGRANLRLALDTLVLLPFEDTFQRPLGDL